MAKYECNIYDDFDHVLSIIEDGVLNGSASAHLEDKSDLYLDDLRCSVRVFERYSLIGGNRVSLNITLFSNGEETKLSAITSGGSQAVFFKLNTLGESSFLDSFIDMLKDRGLKIKTLYHE